MFIGDHGRVITLKHFKGMVVFLILAAVVSIGLAAGFFFLNQNIAEEKNQLASDLESLQKQMDALRHEKDLLMAQLVITESRLAKSVGAKPENPPEVEPGTGEQQRDGSVETKQSDPQAAKKTGVPLPKEPEPEAPSEAVESNLSVAIEKFQVSGDADSDSLTFQFKIKNTSPNSQYVSGHAIVVLEGQEILPNDWLSIPRMPLVEGKPTGKQRGYAFGINYFRTMRFSAPTPELPEKYQNASVYVFARSGELLLEEQFPVSLPETDRREATPPAPATPSRLPEAPPATGTPSQAPVENLPQ